MNILTTTFYADFVRYFNYIEKCFEDRIEKVSFYNIAIYPSAHYQWKKYNRHSILLPNHVMKSKTCLDNIPQVYKEINLEEIISFSYKTQKMFNREHTTSLKKQAIRYIDYFENLFTENTFDLYISSGDSRMLIRIADYFAKKNKVKIFYFEQGPFGTTIFDKKGVNCNISFTENNVLDKKIDREKLYTYIKSYYQNRPVNYWKVHRKTFSRRMVNFYTFLWMYPPKYLHKLFPIDTQIGDFFFTTKRKQLAHKYMKLTQITQDDPLPSKYITFIMQVPSDAQLIENSSVYNSFLDMLVDIHNSMPKGYNLVVREHPYYKGQYPKELYEYISKQSNIYLRSNLSLLETIKKTKLVILNNSTVGIEALVFYKTVLTLGNAYYNLPGITYHLQNKEELRSLIQSALENPIKKDKIDNFLYYFLYDYLYIGHFQDDKLQNGAKIVNDMIRELRR